MAWYDLDTNQIIVYTTVVIFIVVIVTCTTMWIVRPRKIAPKTAPPTIADEAPPTKKQPRGTPNKAIDNVDTKTDVSSRSSKESDGEKGKKKKGKKKTSGTNLDVSKAAAGGGNLRDVDEISESSTLLGRDGLGESKIAEAPLSEADDKLIQAFRETLSHGTTLTLYSLKGAKQVKMTLVGTELRWVTQNKVFAKQGKKIDLRDIRFVQAGKQTKKFNLPLGRRALDDNCYSIVTENDSLDFELTSKVERDAHVQGFSIILSRLSGSGGGAESVAWNV